MVDPDQATEAASTAALIEPTLTRGDRDAWRDLGDTWPLTLEQAWALDKALWMIRAEVVRAARKHGGRPFASPHEGYGVLLEEVDEFWDEIKANNATAALEEVIQVGAMAAYYVTSFAQVPDHAYRIPQEVFNG